MSLQIKKVQPNLNSIESAIKQSLKDQGIDKKIVRNKLVFIKVNIVYDRLMIGAVTSPYILDAVIKIAKEYSNKIIVGDIDDIFHKVKLGFRRCGTERVCRNHRVGLVDLTKEEFIEVPTRVPGFKTVSIPKIVHQAETFITVPVLKTHFESDISGALKNQYGLLPMYRPLYHHKIGYALAAVHSTLKNRIVIADATISMEGHGPIMGNPVEMGLMLVGDDYVACDSAFCQLISIKPNQVDHIIKCQKYKIGQIYEKPIIQSDIKRFSRAKRNTIQDFARRALKVPIKKKIFYYNQLVWMAEKTILHTRKNILWYNLKGRPITQKLLKENKFGKLWQPYLEGNPFSHPLDIAISPITSPGKYTHGHLISD